MSETIYLHNQSGKLFKCPRCDKSVRHDCESNGDFYQASRAMEVCRLLRSMCGWPDMTLDQQAAVKDAHKLATKMLLFYPQIVPCVPLAKPEPDTDAE